MATLEIGSTVSRYRIISRLGAGGMGEVYRAHDPSLDRQIALKILPPELVRNEDRVRRFEQEAKSASALSHPHIVTIHEVGEARIPAVSSDAGAGSGSTASIRYIAMELVDGALLQNRIGRDRAELRDLVRWMSQAAEGLAKAHASGIVHRDLKPENIMITSDGYAKVLDFGLAKLTEVRTEQTNAPTAVRDQTGEGVVLGTVGYMSPEQVQGKKVDARSDIFSLGCILYEAVTAERPFAGATHVDVMHSILHDSPRPIRELNPDVPDELRRLIRRCLAKDADRRFQSMKDVAIELADMVEEWDVLTREGSTVSSSGTGALRAVRGGKIRGVVLALVAAGIALALTALYLRQRDSGSTTASSAGALRASFTQLTSDAGVESQPSISPDGNFVVYASPVSGNWDLYLLRIGGRNPINLTGSSSADDTDPAFSPDGESIAFRSERSGGGIFTIGATGESVRRLTDFGYDPSWAPDGKRIVVSGESPISPYVRGILSPLWSVEVSSGQATKIFDGDAVQPSWSPDGTRIAFWGLPEPALGHRDLGVIPAEGGQVEWITRDEALDWNPVWSPDSRFLYFSSDRGGTLNLWRISVSADGRREGDPIPITTPSRETGYLSVAPDGKRIVLAALETNVNIEALGFEPASKSVVGPARPLTRGTMPIAEFGLSPDDRWVAYRTSGRREDLFVAQADGSNIRKLTDDAAKDRAPSWHPDRERIAFYSDRSGRYEMWMINRDGSGLQQITELSSERSYWFPFFSPDGTRLAAMNEGGSIVFDLSQPFPLKQGTRLPPLRDAGAEIPFLAGAWSPDGNWIAGLRGNFITELVGVSIYSVAEQTYRHLTPMDLRALSLSMSWMPDGQSILMSTASSLILLEVETGERRILHTLQSGSLIADVDVSSDGREIFYVHVNEQADLWIATLQE